MASTKSRVHTSSGCPAITVVKKEPAIALNATKWQGRWNVKKLVYEVSFVIDEDEVLETTQWVMGVMAKRKLLSAGYRVAEEVEVKAAEVLKGLWEELSDT